MAQNDTRELGQFIPLHYHYEMLYDRVRMAGFRAALNQAVKPGATVLELGSGTGVLSFFAAEKARKVYSVEFNPELVEEARRLLKLNNHGDRVEVIHADAFEYIPPEPVDVVVCEMLHVGLLREKQLEMIDAFKKRYARSFKDHPMPTFVPTAVVQAIQPVQHDFVFNGFYAPIIMFQSPYGVDPRTTTLGDPVLYHQLLYDQPYGLSCEWRGSVHITVPGTLNALRVITKNILAIDPETQANTDWYNQYLIKPLEQEIEVRAGQCITVSLDYPSGAPISAFCPAITL
ncbi:MAG: methyltransferase domain-containing protein [Spirochaetes bacterium]|nr:methyltransferase domain-containing protein [Spirochaetota bacterium]